MEKLLFVNACINRGRSRTLRLARELVGRFPDHEVDEVVLEELKLEPLDSEAVNRRNSLAEQGRFDDQIFCLAHKLAEADIIVIATPFWEDCFNSMTKVFMEYSGAVGVAFRYSDEGLPVGLCRARCLYYVTTRGGCVDDEHDLGYAVYRGLAETYGIKETRIISASGLDVVTNDPEKIMADAISKIDGRL